jgi:hypothetical protein
MQKLAIAVSFIAAVFAQAYGSHAPDDAIVYVNGNDVIPARFDHGTQTTSMFSRIAVQVGWRDGDPPPTGQFAFEPDSYRFAIDDFVAW